ncbi:hypothetical protein GCM10009821_28460 [Aeromicrobium halocynthiae]|uniref:Uncharacterized protein n=1 Tax=Aeromicrobium halocynthiae TaxID=560557 RepID=A0ABN2W6S7_9ACTN
MWGDRSGREPVRARSPLRMRRRTAMVGALLCVGAAVTVALLGPAPQATWLAGVLVAASIAGVVDATVITRRLRRQDR